MLGWVSVAHSREVVSLPLLSIRRQLQTLLHIITCIYTLKVAYESDLKLFCFNFYFNDLFLMI